MFIGHLGCETEMPSRCGGGGLPLRVGVPYPFATSGMPRFPFHFFDNLKIMRVKCAELPLVVCIF